MGRAARKVRGVAAVVLGMVLAVGLASTAFAGDAAVKAIGFGFTPSSVTVTVGGTVTWTNGDGVNHTATADDGSWDTSTIASGSTASMTFNTVGTFPYHCAIHASMHGTVVVDAATAPATDTLDASTTSRRGGAEPVGLLAAAVVGLLFGGWRAARRSRPRSR